MAAHAAALCCMKRRGASKQIIATCIVFLCVFVSQGVSVFGVCFPRSMGQFRVINDRVSKELHRKEEVAQNEDSKERKGRDANPDRPHNSTDVTLLASIAEITSSSAVVVTDQLTYMQTMTAGALSRTMAQTLMHPANTYKTLLQLRGSGKAGGVLTKLTPERLLRGVDAQFIMSLPHGAFYFFVIDQVKTKLSGAMSSKFDFLQDFAASTISTVFCSIVSTPQMVLTDRLMAGVYPTSMDAVKSILSTEGIAGFYTGWWPALAQKIPSYG